MAQSVSRRFLTAEDPVQSLFSPGGICNGELALRQVLQWVLRLHLSVPSHHCFTLIYHLPPTPC